MVFRLPPLPSTTDLIKLYGLSAKKELSQNFILDGNLNRKIARTAGPLKGKVFFDVGSGPGSLARALLQEGCEHVIAIEKDPRFIPALSLLQEGCNNRLTIVHGDALEIDELQEIKKVFPTMAQKSFDHALDEHNVALVGNLPFSVATPLLVKWIKQIPQRKGIFAYGRAPIVLNFQEEVARRIAANEPIHNINSKKSENPNKHNDNNSSSSKLFTRLSVLTQTYCTAKYEFTIHSKSFIPSPQVNGGVVRIVPKLPSEIDYNIIPHLDALEEVLKRGFNQKRKTMKTALEVIFPNSMWKKLLNEEQLKELDELKQKELVLTSFGINPTSRPEDVNVKSWNSLAKRFEQFFVDRV